MASDPRSPRNRLSAGGVVASGLALLLACAACSSSSSNESSTTSEQSSLESLEAGVTGYELQTTFLGQDLRRVLVLASPIGRTQKVDVRIETGETWVAATIDVVVERSQASGESDTILLTLLSVDASDEAMANGLSQSVGDSLIAVRGRHHVVEEYDWSNVSSTFVDGDSIDEEPGAQIGFWLRQLLQAPVAFAGPIPDIALGEGAVWETRFVDADGSHSSNRHTLTRLNSDRYLIQVEDQDQNRSHSAVLEGDVGEPIPDRQQITIDQIVTTISASA